MSQKKSQPAPQFGQIRNVSELGAIMRNFRKSQQLTLETVAGVTNVSMRFLSELERGKETASLGKAIATLNKLGLEIIIQPRGFTAEYEREQRSKGKLNDES